MSAAPAPARGADGAAPASSHLSLHPVDLVWRRGWRMAHRDRGDGRTRCGRLLLAAQRLDTTGAPRICALCRRERKAAPTADLGVFCMRCGRHEGLSPVLWQRRMEIVRFRSEHSTCDGTALAVRGAVR